MDTKLCCLTALLVLSAVATCTGLNGENDTNGTTTLQPEPNSTTTLTTTDSNATESTTLDNTTVVATTTATPNSTTPTNSTSAPTTEQKTSIAPVATTTEASNGTAYYYSTHEPTPSPSCPTRSFDAASFVGGIVLGLGLCGISFFLYKWYQSKRSSASPYHQF